MSNFKNNSFITINSLVHPPFEKLGDVHCETSVNQCVTVDVSHIIFGNKGYFHVKASARWP